MIKSGLQVRESGLPASESGLPEMINLAWGVWHTHICCIILHVTWARLISNYTHTEVAGGLFFLNLFDFERGDRHLFMA